jgi:hypothetical protein
MLNKWAISPIKPNKWTLHDNNRLVPQEQARLQSRLGVAIVYHRTRQLSSLWLLSCYAPLAGTYEHGCRTFIIPRKPGVVNSQSYVPLAGTIYKQPLVPHSARLSAGSLYSLFYHNPIKCQYPGILKFHMWIFDEKPNEIEASGG